MLRKVVMAIMAMMMLFSGARIYLLQQL